MYFIRRDMQPVIISLTEAADELSRLCHQSTTTETSFMYYREQYVIITELICEIKNRIIYEESES